MILVDCVTGTPSFIHVNVSGGEPDEVQDNVMLDPKSISTADDDDNELSVIIGAAAGNVLNKMIRHYKVLTSYTKIKSYANTLIHQTTIS